MVGVVMPPLPRSLSLEKPMTKGTDDDNVVHVEVKMFSQTIAFLVGIATGYALHTFAPASKYIQDAGKVARHVFRLDAVAPTPKQDAPPPTGK